ncbi:MAG: tetratricopeptide repeat protein [Bryobacteraceae bacterium]
MSLGLLLAAGALGQQSLWQSYVDSAARHAAEGRFKQARQLLVNALAAAERFPAADARLPLTLSRLASVYTEQARFEEANELLDRAVALRRAIPNSALELAALTGQLAELRRRQGRYPEAEQLHLEALEVFLSRPGGGGEQQARETALLAGLYREQGKYAEADVLYVKALAGLETKLGAGDAAVLSVVHELGTLRQAEGRYLEAEALFRRAAAKDDPEAKLLLGGYYLAASDFGQAAVHLRGARDALARRWGDFHPSIAEADRLLAETALAQRRFTEAGPLFERARASLAEIHSPEHPAIAPVLSGMARWHAYQGRFGEAQRLFSEAVILQSKAFGNNHPALVETAASLGVLERALGRYQESEKVLRSALGDAVRLLGNTHPIVATVRNNLGNTLLDLRRFDDAEAEYNRALAIREKFAGPESPAAAEVRLNLAAVYQARGDAAKALPLIQAALPLWRAALRAGHPDLVRATRQLAVCDLEVGNLAEAERSFRALMASGPPDPEALDALSRIYRRQGRWAEAEPVDRKRMESRSGIAAARAAVDLAETLEGLRREEEARRLLEGARASIVANRAPAGEEAALRVALGELEFRAGRYDQARREAETAETLLANEPERQAAALRLAGNALREKGDYEGAADRLQRAVNLERKSIGDRAELAAALHGLARARTKLSQFDAADAAFEEEMAIWRALGREQTEAAAAGLREWAAMALAKGNTETAARRYRESEAILRARFGDSDTRLAAVLSGRGETEAARGRYAEAENHFAAALAIQEAAVGASDASIAPIVNALANAQRRAGKLAQADENYRRGLAMLESTHGADHPEVATALANIADLYREMKKHGEAIALLGRAETILRKAGGDPLKLAEVLNQRGALHAQRREFAKADPLFAGAMRLLADGRGERSLAYSSISENLAFSKAMQRDFNAAERLYRQALTLREQLLGRENPALAPLLENYGALLRLRKRDAEAGVMLDRARALRQSQATSAGTRR